MADRLAGVGSSAELLRLRLSEDRAALGSAGCEWTNLDFVEDQYRTEPPALDDLETAFRTEIPRCGLLFAPAAIGGHPDHKLIRDLALRLALEGWRVELYADIPYTVRYGWPAWVTGIEVGPHLNVEAYWADFLNEITERDYRITVRRHDLGEKSSDEKLQAMLMYATQFQQLNSGIVNRLRNPAIRRYELSWEVS